jgi:hypothetical protein
MLTTATFPKGVSHEKESIREIIGRCGGTYLPVFAATTGPRK